MLAHCGSRRCTAESLRAHAVELFTTSVEKTTVGRNYYRVGVKIGDGADASLLFNAAEHHWSLRPSRQTATR